MKKKIDIAARVQDFLAAEQGQGYGSRVELLGVANLEFDVAHRHAAPAQGPPTLEKMLDSTL